MYSATLCGSDGAKDALAEFPVGLDGLELLVEDGVVGRTNGPPAFALSNLPQTATSVEPRSHHGTPLSSRIGFPRLVGKVSTLQYPTS